MAVLGVGLTWQWYGGEVVGESLSEVIKVILQGDVVTLVLHGLHLQLADSVLHVVYVLTEDGVLFLVVCVLLSQLS